MILVNIRFKIAQGVYHGKRIKGIGKERDQRAELIVWLADPGKYDYTIEYLGTMIRKPEAGSITVF